MSEEQGRTNPPGNDPYSDSENEDDQKVEVPWGMTRTSLTNNCGAAAPCGVF